MLQNPGKALRKLLQGPDIIMAPGIYDCISARVAEQAGFPMGYLSGAGVATGYLGEPDIGLTNGSDVADVARRIAVKATTPFITDADTGYGNALNVIRTVWDLEMAGSAGIQLEDQAAPKRCGHLNGKQCIPAEEFAAKIRAAKYEKMYPETVIVARTDARAVYDLDEALRRGEMYLNAGADVLFIEAPQTLEEIRKESSLPILMFTSRNDSISKVRGLRAGADDYLTKPFDMEELIARIVSLIRRYTRFNQPDGAVQKLVFDGLEIDPEARLVTVENSTLELPPKEFDLLLYCAKNQGKILTKKQIYENVWGDEYLYDDSNIMAVISRLRKKLEAAPSSPKYIQTIKGIGYRFNKEV